VDKTFEEEKEGGPNARGRRQKERAYVHLAIIVAHMKRMIINNSTWAYFTKHNQIEASTHVYICCYSQRSAFWTTLLPPEVMSDVEQMSHFSSPLPSCSQTGFPRI
jgi:hypothetical protein